MLIKLHLSLSFGQSLNISFIAVRGIQDGQITPYFEQILKLRNRKIQTRDDIGWLVGGWEGWWVGWLVGWWLAGWLIGWLIDYYPYLL